MSQKSGVDSRSAAEGPPYGPANPPPPPPGSPPHKSNRHPSKDRSDELPPEQGPRQSEDSTRRRPKYTTGQKRKYKRGKRLAELERNGGRSCSLSLERRRKQSGETRYRERSPMRRSQKQERADAPWSQGLRRDRKPLRDALQYTPNQIIDDTYGGLSRGNGSRDNYQEQQGDAQDRAVLRNDWPYEQSWSTHRDADEKVGYPQGQNDWSLAGAPRGQATDRYDDQLQGGFPAPYGDNTKQDWSANAVPHDNGPHPRPSMSQNYDIENEVSWDDDEPIAAFDPVQPLALLHTGDSASQHEGFVGQTLRTFAQGTTRPAFHPSLFAREPMRSASPLADQRGWQQHSGKSYNKEVHHTHPQPYQAQGGGRRPPKWDFASSCDPALFAQPARVAPGKQQAHKNLLARGLQDPEVPSSVYDLHKYDAHITAMHKALPQHLRYINGNGKVAPYMYGSRQGLDLGLCFVTFKTRFRCELGVACAWRHHPLTKAEREWIVAYGRERGTQFLDDVKKCWPNPEVPVPGASMHDK